MFDPLKSSNFKLSATRKPLKRFEILKHETLRDKETVNVEDEHLVLLKSHGGLVHCRVMCRCAEVFLNGEMMSFILLIV